MGARSEPPLVQGHQEPDRPSARIVVLIGGAPTLALHEPRDLPVELELRTVDGEVGRARDSLCEDRPCGPRSVGLPLGKVDHRLLDAPQVERGTLLIHRLPYRFHVAVGVRVEQLKEKREVLRIALVRSGRQEEHVVRVVPEQFPESVTLALVALIPRRHPVRLVHDDEIPMRLPQTRQDLVALRKVERRDDPLPLHPPVDPELVADVSAFQNQKLLVELLLQFPLPLEREVRGTDHENPLGQAPKLQFADEQSGHDRLPRASVVGEQETDARKLQQVIVDSLKLVGQWVQPRDGKSEVWIELVRNAQCLGLQGQAQAPTVSGVGEDGLGNRQL